MDAISGISESKYLGGKKRSVGEEIEFQQLLTREDKVRRFPKTPADATGYRLKGRGDLDLIGFSKQLTAGHGFDALFFGGNQFGKQGLDALSDALRPDSTVKHLILSNSGISDFALQGLADMLKVNHEIGWVVLNGNSLGDVAAGQLAEALKGNEGVQHLILADNEIGDKGSMDLARMLEENSSLKSLFLQGNKIGEDGLRAFLEVLSRKTESGGLEVLDLSGNLGGAERGKQGILLEGERLGVKVLL